MPIENVNFLPGPPSKCRGTVRSMIHDRQSDPWLQARSKRALPEVTTYRFYITKISEKSMLLFLFIIEHLRRTQPLLCIIY
jgi:hypothetical protein